MIIKPCFIFVAFLRRYFHDSRFENKMNTQQCLEDEWPEQILYQYDKIKKEFFCLLFEDGCKLIHLFSAAKNLFPPGIKSIKLFRKKGNQPASFWLFYAF